MQNESLIDTLKKHNLWANKALGQHFLHDISVCSRMLKHLNLENQIVVEVGPGPGSLTGVLKNLPLKFFLAIEKDARFIKIIDEITAQNSNFSCLEKDALKVSIPKTLADLGYTEPYHIIANLPYNIGTELLVNWAEDLNHLASITVMLQKEVVDRIRARVNTGDYGRLSILLQNCFKVQELFRVPAGAFVPPPKVLSSIVYLEPLKNLPNPEILKTLGKITQIAFSQRRKMLRSSLGKQIPLDLWQQICAQLNIDDAHRPETITPEIFYQMAELCQTFQI